MNGKDAVKVFCLVLEEWIFVDEMQVVGKRLQGK
jgi:hypothetical protein